MRENHMRPHFRTLLFAIAATVLAAVAPAHAADGPSRPVTLIVPFPPGGFTDSVARAVAPELSRALGQPVVVENRPGAGGRIGIDIVARSPADSYTLGVTVPANYSLLPVIDKKYAEITEQLTPVMIAVRTQSGIAINPEKTPANNLAEFLAYAKANPGKIAYGTAGAGTSFHFWSEAITQTLGIDAVHVPYKGEAPVVTDLIGGQIQYALVTGSAKPMIDSGKLRLLVVAAPERWPLFPDVPTLKELGFEPIDSSGWLGFVTAPRAPAEVVERLNSGLAHALAAPAVRQYLEGLGYQIVASKPEAMASTMLRETTSFSNVLKSGRIKLD